MAVSLWLRPRTDMRTALTRLVYPASPASKGSNGSPRTLGRSLARRGIKCASDEPWSVVCGEQAGEFAREENNDDGGGNFSGASIPQSTLIES